MKFEESRIVVSEYLFVSESKVDALFDFENGPGLLGSFGGDLPHGLEHEDIEIVHDEHQKHFDAVSVVGLVKTWFVRVLGK